MRSIFSFQGAALVLLASLLYNWWQSPSHSSRYLPWHDTTKWERFFVVYDRMASLHFDQHCDAELIDTDFGKTHTFQCGDTADEDAPTVVFLHGAGMNSMQFADWIVPNVLRTNTRCIVLDLPCDVGKSIPPEGDPQRCASTKEQMVQWMEQVIHGTVGKNKKVSLVGYSYGVFVALATAAGRPELVDKMVWIAPSGIIASVELRTFFQAIMYSLIKTAWMQNIFFQYMAADPDFDMATSVSPNLREMTESIREVDATLLSVYDPDLLSEEALASLASKHPTFLVVGEQETFLNATMAVDAAQRAGMKAKLYRNAGQLMYLETTPARDEAAQDITAFLTGGEIQTVGNEGDEEHRKKTKQQQEQPPELDVVFEHDEEFQDL